MDDCSIVLRNLQEFIDKGLGEYISQGIEKACLAVEADAKRNCSTGDGQLRNSITHEVEEFEGVVGSTVEYAPYVEIGTGIHSTQGDGRQTPWVYYSQRYGQFFTTDGMEAKPFLQPALEANRKNIEEYFKELI